MEESNAVLTSFNSAGMEHLAQMTMTMNVIQAQLKTLSLTSTNPTRTKRKFYCWSCGSNFNQGSKTFPDNKTGHKEEAYYKK